MFKHIHIVMLLIGIVFAYSANAWAFDTSTNPTPMPTPTYHSYPQPKKEVLGLGQVANNILEPVTVASNFLAGAAIVIGMTCIFSAFLRYMQHRVNPLAQPISTVILLLVLGFFLLVLPLVYKLTESGIPFSLG